MRRSARFTALVIAAVAAALILPLWLAQRPPRPDPASLRAYIDKNESRLITRAETRSPVPGPVTAPVLSWDTGRPEGGLELWYAESGALEYAGHAFTDTARLEDLGANGKGWIDCVRLKDRWFLIDYDLPT